MALRITERQTGGAKDVWRVNPAGAWLALLAFDTVLLSLTCGVPHQTV